MILFQPKIQYFYGFFSYYISTILGFDYYLQASCVFNCKNRDFFFCVFVRSQMPVLDNNFLKSKIWAYVTNNFNLLESWDLGRVLFAKKNPMGIIIGKRFKQE